MLRPAAFSGSICLRCQARCYRQPRPLLGVSQPVAPNTRRFGIDSKLAEQQPIPNDHATAKAPEWKRVELAFDRRQRYKRLGKKQVVSLGAERLGVNILGKPAHAIVLRDVNPSDVLQDETEEEAAEVRPQKTSIETTLNDQRRDPTADEVRKNLDELRPSGTATTLQKTEFDLLLNRILAGFTSSQLRTYLWLTRKKRRDVEREERRYGWVTESNLWEPIRPKGEGTTVKESLAIELMYSRWHLRIQEHESAVGKLEVDLPPRMSILLTHKGEILEKVRTDLAIPGDHFQLSLRNSTLQIIATKPRALLVLERLDAIQKDMHETHMSSTDLLGSRTLSPRIWKELGELTDIWVEYKSSSKKTTDGKPVTIRACWLGTPVGVHSQEAVRGALVRHLYAAARRTLAEKCLVTVSGTEGCVLVKQQRGQHQWHWMRRPTAAVRLVRSIGPKETEQVLVMEADKMATPAQAEESSDTILSKPEPVFTDTAIAALPQGTLQNLLDGRTLEMQRSSLETEMKEMGSIWSAPNIQTTSTFGYILHPVEDDARSTQYFPNRPLDPLESFLSPITPPRSSLVSITSNPRTQPHLFTATTVYRLYQHPLTAPYPRDLQAPDLELHVTKTSPEEPGSSDTCSTRLFAVRDAFQTHILLPDADVDIQLSQTLISELPVDSLSKETQHAITTYVTRLKKGHSIASTSFMLDMPLIRQLNKYPSPPNSISPDATVPESSKIKVRYLLAATETHHTLQMEYHGHRLRYRRVEGGRDGGRRIEVALETLQPEGRDGVEETIETEKAARSRERHYMQTVYDIATGKHFPWLGHGNLSTFLTEKT